ncbi:MAG: hypothetical protein EKK61_02240 [Rickettsiales bacterium]|nr:MAG: hypothetical protein EKK61_02240 [Rickettsiales bacterium]
MKANLFSPILMFLILVLFAKASMLFSRIQEQTSYSVDTSTSSILIDTAYAGGHGAAKKEESSHKSNEAEHGAPPTPVDMGAKLVTTSDPIATVSTANNNSGISNLSRSEIELLKELQKRRNNIDKEKTNLNVREQVLKETENKIDKKVIELQNLQNQVEDLMKQYNQKENSKILSLVKIYENMKPKDAAKIFNELEMPILIKVISNMKEVKVAPIIAAMDSTKARDVSLEIAKQKPIE